MRKSLQKILLSLMTFVLFFSAAPYMTFTADAAAKTSYLTLDEAMEWLDSTVGEKRGDGQCIAFIKDYYQVMTGYLPSGNACDYANNTLPSGFGWKRIRGEKNLRAGDILIWTGGTGGNGHAAIYGGDGKYYHQKWTGMYVEIIEKAYLNGFPIRRSGSYARYWGVIRPSFRSESAFEELTDSNYRIKNLYSGRYLTAKGSTQLSTQRIKSSASKSQLFTFEQAEVGYELSPLVSSGLVSAFYEEGKTLSGTRIGFYKDGEKDSARWRVEKVSGGYVIRSVYNPSLCLTADKRSSKLSVETYKGSKNQKWKLESAPSVSYDGNGGWDAPTGTTAEEGDSHKISKKTPNRVGYKFLGWSERKKAKKATFLSGSSITLEENTVLYAVWKRSKEYEIASVKLSETEYTYDGTVKTPDVTVKDTNGNTLREGKDYTVSYSKGRKKVGRYRVTVNYKGKFSGRDKHYFTVTR